MKGSFKYSLKTSNLHNSSKNQLPKTMNSQISHPDSIYIQNAQFVPSSNHNYQSSKMNKKPFTQLQTIKEVIKSSQIHQKQFPPKKYQPPQTHFNPPNSKIKNQTSNRKMSDNQLFKPYSFFQAKPLPQQNKKNMDSNKNNHNLLAQQYIKQLNNQQFSQTDRQWQLSQFNKFIYSPSTPTTIKSSKNNYQMLKTEPFFKNKIIIQNSKPISTTNQKKIFNSKKFPILRKFQEDLQTPKFNKTNKSNQNMKYSMISPQSNESERYKNVYSNEQLQKKIQYFQELNEDNQLRQEDYIQCTPVRKYPINIQTPISRTKSEACINKPHKYIQTSKSSKNILKSVKVQQNCFDQGIKKTIKIQNKSNPTTNVKMPKTHQVSTNLITKQYHLMSHKSQKQFISYQSQDKIKSPKSFKNVQQPQKQQKKQDNKNKISLKKQLKDQKQLKSTKLGQKLKKQALNKLRKQYQAPHLTQSIYNQDKLGEQFKNNKQKSQITKIKHLFAQNICKQVNQNDNNVKLPLSIIQEQPQKQKKTQAKLNLPTLQKKVQKTTGKTRRLSEPLNPQCVRKEDKIEYFNQNKNHIKLDQTMETQEIKFRSLKITDFVRGPQLGRGKFGVVNLARHRKTGFLFALKTLKKLAIVEENIIDQVIREIKIQYYLDHSNLVKLYGFFFDRENIYLIMEFCPQGQLYKVLQNKKKFSEEETCHIMKQLCEGIYELHKKKIIHRDMKPQNVVVSFGVCKICDFGWSIYSQNQFRNTLCGTPLYFSPELLAKGVYNEKVDIWALGVMAFEMVTGSIPFIINNKNELMKIVNQEIHYPIWMSPPARDFIGMFLQKNPELRFTMASILQHKFLKDSNNLNSIQIKSKDFQKLVAFQ